MFSLLSLKKYYKMCTYNIMIFFPISTTHSKNNVLIGIFKNI